MKKRKTLLNKKISSFDFDKPLYKPKCNNSQKFNEDELFTKNMINSQKWIKAFPNSRDFSGKNNVKCKNMNNKSSVEVNAIDHQNTEDKLNEGVQNEHSTSFSSNTSNIIKIINKKAYKAKCARNT